MSQQHPTFVDRFTRPIEIRPDNTALIVVDMQNATGNRNMGLGKLLADEGRADSAIYRFDRIENLLVPNIRRLIDACRDVGARVVYVTYGSELEDYTRKLRSLRGLPDELKTVLEMIPADAHPPSASSGNAVCRCRVLNVNDRR